MDIDKVSRKLWATISPLVREYNIDLTLLIRTLSSRPIKAIWINKQAGFNPKKIETVLKELGMDIRHLRGESFIYYTPDNPNTPIFQTGGYYIAEVVNSYLPFIWRNITGNVLDIAASPGGKTFLIANIYKGRGSIISNEPIRTRRRKLIRNVIKYALDDVRIAGYRGEKFPITCRFNYILFDAPCSAIDLLYKRPKEVLKNITRIKYFSSLQKKVIRRIAELLAEGGELIYSTCTMTLEETIDISRSCIDMGLKTIPIRSLPFKTSEAFDPWGTHPELKNTLFILPTENYHGFGGNIGLAYIARFKKEGKTYLQERCDLGIKYKDEKADTRYASHAYKKIMLSDKTSIDAIHLDINHIIKLMREKEIEYTGMDKNGKKLIVYGESPMFLAEKISNRLVI